MQREGLRCRVRMKKRKTTGQPAQPAEHLLKRQFHAATPLQKLVTDITYLPFGGMMLYLSSILDLYIGEIVAYSIADKQDTSFDWIRWANFQSGPTCCSTAIRAVVFTSQAYQALVKGKGITMSMSRKGTPADNAPIESFHSTLKSETFYLEDLMLQRLQSLNGPFETTAPTITAGGFSATGCLNLQGVLITVSQTGGQSQMAFSLFMELFTIYLVLCSSVTS